MNDRSSTFVIDDNMNFHIKVINYRGSPGVNELLFQKYPLEDLYNENDLRICNSILTVTNVCRCNHLPRMMFKLSRGEKYKEIISLMFGNSFGHG